MKLKQVGNRLAKKICNKWRGEKGSGTGGSGEKRREFWRRGYYANTAGKNAIKIVERVEHQMKKGRAGEPPTMLK